MFLISSRGGPPCPPVFFILFLSFPFFFYSYSFHFFLTSFILSPISIPYPLIPILFVGAYGIRPILYLVQSLRGMRRKAHDVATAQRSPKAISLFRRGVWHAPNLFSVLPISESALLSFPASFERNPNKQKNAQSELGSTADLRIGSFIGFSWLLNENKQKKKMPNRSWEVLPISESALLSFSVGF